MVSYIQIMISEIVTYILNLLQFQIEFLTDGAIIVYKRLRTDNFFKYLIINIVHINTSQIDTYILNLPYYQKHRFYHLNLALQIRLGSGNKAILRAQYNSNTEHVEYYTENRIQTRTQNTRIQNTEH